MDLLVETEDGFNVAEFKFSMTVMPDMFKPMQKIEEILGWENLKKNLVYNGEQSQKRSYRNVVLWNKFGLLY